MARHASHLSVLVRPLRHLFAVTEGMQYVMFTCQICGWDIGCERNPEGNLAPNSSHLYYLARHLKGHAPS